MDQKERISEQKPTALDAMSEQDQIATNAVIRQKQAPSQCREVAQTYNLAPTTKVHLKQMNMGTLSQKDG